MKERIWLNIDSTWDNLPKPLIIIDELEFQRFNQEWTNFDIELINKQRELNPFLVFWVWEDLSPLDIEADFESYAIVVEWMKAHYTWTDSNIQINTLSI